jgi:transcriptional regulator with XRE-family HTH domain
MRIKELRNERKLSMAQVARDLNIPYTTYVNYEKEAREPNSELLIQLADYFNCSVDYLIGRSNERITDKVLDKVNEIDNDILKKYGNIYQAKKAMDSQSNIDTSSIQYAAYQELEGESDEVVKDVINFIKFRKSQEKNNE